MEASTEGAVHINRNDVQGNLVGFNKDHQRFVFLQFPDTANGRAFLASIQPDLASTSEVLMFNQLHKEIHVRRGGATQIVESTWTNLALTFTGLQALGADGLDTFPEEFKQGMAARAQEIGDLDDSAPGGWVAPFGQQIHAMAIIAADTIEDLESGDERLAAKCQAHAITELGHLDGNTRPDPNRGHEHFGFKDGISQPGIAGLTRSSKVGQDVIATGEFVIGYLDQDGHLSGQPVPVPEPGQPGYSSDAPPADQPLPDWAKNGSFVVFRRLRQNVQAFNDFLAQEASQVGLEPEQFASKLVGRWRSGAPLERTRDQAADFDPTVVDPSAADPSVLSDREINNFDYDPHDGDGHLVPRAAHIRKANPRNEEPPGKEESNRHRILRRGIPYGPEFQPGEPPYPGAGPVPDTQDRGLLFLCYQSSLVRGFEFVQSQWANKPDFPQPGDGRDPIISQDVSEREFSLPPRNPHLLMQRWVQMTGGQYFFAPSISAVGHLVQAVSPAGNSTSP
jgi:Dyp-type peroxidase family